MNYYEHHIGDYLKDTAHLSLVEHGVYRRLMDVYYTREAPLPRDPSRLIGARSKEEREAVLSVLDEFFVTDGNEWLHKRCDEEIARYRAKQDNARASAKARWSKTDRNANASTEHGASGDAQRMRTHSEGNATRARPQSPDTKHQTPDLAHSPNAPGDTSTPDGVDHARRPDDHQLTLVEGGRQEPWSPPDCPHLAVLALWAEVLPSLPQHEATQWKGARADHLRARWRETAEEKRWPDQAAGLAYFRKLFAFVGKSAFLTGRADTAPGKRPFFVELEWLIKPGNWAKLIEGKYHTEAA